MTTERRNYGGRAALSPTVRRTVVAVPWRVFLISRTLVATHRFQLGASVIFAAVALARVLATELPLSTGGLYALMAHSIEQDNFVLPGRIPYYGPGGIPFAYPPLALYVLAAASRLSGLSILTWLRFMPVIFCALSLWPTYRLYSDLLPRTWMARCATVLFASAPAWLALNLWADGSVRSFAFFWAMLALVHAWRALATGSRGSFLGASVCFALTLASHLEVADFAAVSILVFAVGYRPSLQRLVTAVALVVTGILVAAPWWGFVILSHGPQVFLSSLHSHGGAGGYAFSGSASLQWRVAAIVAQFLPTDLVSLPIYALGLLGLARRGRDGAWVLPLWTLACCVFIPEGQRFVALGVAAGAAVPLQEIPSGILTAVHLRPTARRRRIALVALLLIGLFGATHMLGWEFAQRQVLSAQTVNAGEWLRAHSPRNSTFLALSDVQDQPEWFPYFAHRTPVIGHWGAEWTGGYGLQSDMISREVRCSQLQSFACVRALLRSRRLIPGYVILADRGSLPLLERRIEAHSGWERTYANPDTVIWRTLAHRPLP